MRPSLLRHLEWMQLLHKSGFKLVETRDLALEYDLLEDNEDRGIPQESNGLTRIGTHLWSFLMAQFEIFMIISLKPATTGGNNTVIRSQLASLRRLLLLRRGTASVQKGCVARKQAHRDARLGYNIYVLKR